MVQLESPNGQDTSRASLPDDSRLKALKDLSKASELGPIDALKLIKPKKQNKKKPKHI
jgi:hypothetical protein